MTFFKKKPEQKRSRNLSAFQKSRVLWVRVNSWQRQESVCCIISSESVLDSQMFSAWQLRSGFGCISAVSEASCRRFPPWVFLEEGCGWASREWDYSSWVKGWTCQTGLQDVQAKRNETTLLWLLWVGQFHKYVINHKQKSEKVNFITTWFLCKTVTHIV